MDRAIHGDLPALLSALSTADVAFGRRPGRLVEEGAMPWHARLGNDLVAAIMSIRTGRTVHDLPPFKALRASTLARLDLDDAGYGWTTQLVGRVLGEPTIRFRELPVRFRRRQGGTSKVSGSWRASVAAGRAMVGRAWSETAARPLLGLMAKAPGPGRAKTRLAAELGDEAAAAFWTACLSDVAAGSLEASRTARLTPIAMLPSDAEVDAVVGIIGPAWTPIVQTRPGLAAALVDVFLAAFDRGADRAIAVAGDASGTAAGAHRGGPGRARPQPPWCGTGPCRRRRLSPRGRPLAAGSTANPRADPAPASAQPGRQAAACVRRERNGRFDRLRCGQEWSRVGRLGGRHGRVVAGRRHRGGPSTPGGAAGGGRALGATDGRVAEAQPGIDRRSSSPIGSLLTVANGWP